MVISDKLPSYINYSSVDYCRQNVLHLGNWPTLHAAICLAMLPWQPHPENPVLGLRLVASPPNPGISSPLTVVFLISGISQQQHIHGPLTLEQEAGNTCCLSDRSASLNPGQVV